jgi:hypothetical protein
MLDLAESVNRDLGPHSCAYSEDEILDEIECQQPVRYLVEVGNDNVAHIGLSSSVAARREPFKLDWNQKYGGTSGERRGD